MTEPDSSNLEPESSEPGDPRETDAADRADLSQAGGVRLHSSVVVRPKAIVGALMALLILVVSGAVVYNLLTSSGDGDGASEPLTSDTREDRADEGRAGGVDDEGTGGDTDVGGDTDADSDGGVDGGDDSAARDALDDGYRPPAWSLIATLTDDVRSYPQPGAEPDGTVEATWHGRQSALAVVEERPEWLQVRLQHRPNGSTTWVRRGDVEVSSTPYRIRIDVATMRLQLWERAELAMDVPVGIGTDDAPTPTGEFFVAFLQEPPDDGGNWGPFVMVTSGHSETISDFQLSGDAITGIHGPLGAADRIVETGAKVSKGCVRLKLDNLELLRDVPAGSPVDIVDTSVGTGVSA